MNIKLSASMMCARYGNLEQEIKLLEEAGIDSFHIDIMDGQYVPNFGMGLQDLQYISKIAKKPVEIHLMVKNPRSHLDIFMNTNPDVIYIHPESDYHPSTTIQKIIERGIKPGIVINPGTSIETVYELLYIVDRVLFMAVNPGHAGQIYLPYVGRKLEKLLELRDECKFDVFWDGACTKDKIETFAPKGVKGFILGTGLLFGHKESYKELIKKARKF